MEARVRVLSVGQSGLLEYEGRSLRTAIFKRPVTGPVALGPEGLAGDEQADRRNHGGPDKALCAYPYEHYPFWERELGTVLEPPAFGENLTLEGLTEADVCIGDTFELGSALVQVTQPRRPCHVLGKRHRNPGLPLRVQDTGYSGFYLRVLRPGYVQAGDVLRLVARHPAGVTVAEANETVYRRRGDRAALERLLSVPELSASWQAMLARRLQGAEDSEAARLSG